MFIVQNSFQKLKFKHILQSVLPFLNYKIMKYIYLGITLFLFCQYLPAQVLLDADGTGDTYELISSKLAPGHNPIEVPDCGHSDFGDHIDEVFDDELNAFVFRFHMHTDQDDDRCINFDRQRNEIKSYDKSPNNLKAIQGEVVEYKWKFRLPEGFQSSSKFTHIHQLKAVGGTESSMPQITLTTRDGNPDQLELRYAESLTQVTLDKVDLAPFLGTWCEATERVLFGENGTYEIKITRVSDNTTLFSYSNNEIRMWKTEADFIRPKWGIYRSIVFAEMLRDETVLYNNFSITENPQTTSSTEIIDSESDQIIVFPNPASQAFQVDGISKDCKYSIFDSNWKMVSNGETENNQIRFSGLKRATYFIVLETEKGKVTKKIVKY